MKIVKLHCAFCEKSLYRSRGRINEAKKFGWRPFCSTVCHGRIRNQQRKCACSKNGCGKFFLRSPKDARSNYLYCSRSCAVSVNNTRFPKRKAIIKKCVYCRGVFRENKAYCSRACKNKSQVITSEEILKMVRGFYKKHKRIPLKREFLSYRPARDRFGSWNKAIIAAGFKPNPVKFAESHTSKDGHKCYSISEKIIDDWLYEKGIFHKKEVNYPANPKLTADFVTPKYWVEFFGLKGEIKDYDRLIKEKFRIAKKYKLPLVALYPRDLIPVNKLGKILQ